MTRQGPQAGTCMATPEESQARAWQFYHAGNQASAERACLEVLEQQPLHAEALYLLGLIALEGDHTARAVRHFHHAATLQPGNANYHHALGEAFRGWGDSARSILALREALRLDPTRVASYNGLGLALIDGGEP